MNYLPIKILRKNGRKKYFLANFFNKFTRKISCNIRFFSIYIYIYIYSFDIPIIAWCHVVLIKL